MVIRSSRIEVRAEPSRERRLRQAASLAGQTLSAFLLEAADERAERVLAQAQETVVPDKFFDALWQALEKAPSPNAALSRAARRKRRVRQRP